MYEARFYKGDYPVRQGQANEDGCVAYVEHHFNSSKGGPGDYALVVVGQNASSTSKNWGRWYARAVASEFGIGLGGTDGIVVGGFDGRGDYNLRFTHMPAVLLEPLFANNPRHAAWIRSEDGQARLARILADSIRRFFPDGGLIGFSVGHKYRTSDPSARGADVAGGGSEADFAEAVLEKARLLVEAESPAAGQRLIQVTRGAELLWSAPVDPDATVRWDPMRETLIVDA